MAPVLSLFRPTSSADPLALDDKGNSQGNSNDTDDHDPQSDTPGRNVKRSTGSGHARHECSSIRAVLAEQGQIDSFFDVISRTNRSAININTANNRLPADERQDQRQQDTQHDRRRQWEIEAELSSPHDDVAGEPSERDAERTRTPSAVMPRPRKTSSFPSEHLPRIRSGRGRRRNSRFLVAAVSGASDRASRCVRSTPRTLAEASRVGFAGRSRPSASAIS